MADEPKDVAAPVEAPKAEEQEPWTAPQAVAELHLWIERVKFSRLNPTQLMLGVGLEQATGFTRTLLAAMDTAPAKKK